MTSESPVVSINIIKEIPFDGEGDTLFRRLRKVTLRGFPGIKIYEEAQFNPTFLSKEEILRLYTPQPRVYRPNLNRIERLSDLFKKEGIDILNLNKAYDYIAIHESGEITEWTMLPPIIERWHIPRRENKLNYEAITDSKLLQHFKQERIEFNPELEKLRYPEDLKFFDLINDGSHRIHYGLEKEGLKIILISDINKGYPYYAAPQKYEVKISKTREEALKEPETKMHILQDPHHKKLYRLFPSGGIKSGDVRPH